MEGLFKCYLNCFNILKYRNYDVDGYKNISYEEFMERYNYFNSNNNILDIYFENENEITIIHFTNINNSVKLKSTIEKKIIDYYNLSNKNYNIILILTNEINNEKIIEFNNNYDNLTIFFYKEIIVDIMKHSFVPIHIKLNNLEKKKLKKELDLNDFELLPYINVYDPVSKIIGLKENDICKIIRNNKNIGESICYRYCVK